MSISEQASVNYIHLFLFRASDSRFSRQCAR